VNSVLLLWAALAVSAAAPDQARKEWKEFVSEKDSGVREKESSFLNLRDAVYLEKGDTAYLGPKAKAWESKRKGGEILHVFFDGERALLTPRGGEAFDLVEREKWHIPGELFVAANILRDGSLRLYLRDPAHPVVKAFEGHLFYPFDPSWVLMGDFTPTEPKKHSFSTSAGRQTRLFEVGRVAFERKGEKASLRAFALTEDLDAVDELFFAFFDQSSRDTSYGGGRYLYTDVDGLKEQSVELDFNYATNPYCARSKFYNCVRPPGKPLPFAVRAGEMRPAKGDH